MNPDHAWPPMTVATGLVRILTDAEIVSILARARDEHQDLSPDGFLTPPRRGRDPDERQRQHLDSRATMTDPERVAEFRVAWEFLTADGGPLTTGKVNRHGTSYGWKHRAEEWVQDNRPRWKGHAYCSTGVFIVAALAAGCRIERTEPGDPNAFLNLSRFMLPTFDRNGQRRWRDRQSVRRPAA